MKKEYLNYTEKDIHIGLQFKAHCDIYEIISISPFKFKDIKTNTSYSGYSLREAIMYFNDSLTNWTLLTIPKNQNIELWI